MVVEQELLCPLHYENFVTEALSNIKVAAIQKAEKEAHLGMAPRWRGTEGERVSWGRSYCKFQLQSIHLHNNEAE